MGTLQNGSILLDTHLYLMMTDHINGTVFQTMIAGSVNYNKHIISLKPINSGLHP